MSASDTHDAAEKAALAVKLEEIEALPLDERAPEYGEVVERLRARLEEADQPR